MSAALAIADYTLRQHVRQRAYLGLLVFGLLLFGGALVASALAPEQRGRILFDLGFAGIEALALLAAAFLTVGLVLEEMESRTIYLILTHPVPRHAYVLGRFGGTLAAVLAGMAAMAALHLPLLWLFGWREPGFYAVAWLCAALKMSVVGVLALALSLFSSSAPTAMAFTLFLWVLGHFAPEMSFLAGKSGSPLVSGLVGFVRLLTPDMSYFNYRDFAGAEPGGLWLIWLLLYALTYAGIGLYLCARMVAHKEF